MKAMIALVLCAVCALVPVSLNAQLEFGIKAGLTPANTLGNNHVIVNASPSAFTFNTVKSGNEFYGGLIGRYSLDYGFFIQSELLYNYQSTDYLVSYLDNDAPDLRASDAAHQLIIPVVIGVGIGNFEFSSGITSRFSIRQTSDLSEISTYVHDPSTVALGYHAGIGYNLSVVRLEMSYQMDFKNYGADMFINGKELQLSNARNRLIASVSYMF